MSGSRLVVLMRTSVGKNLGARLRLPVWRSNNRHQSAATQSPKAVG
jgi:hypothetical protein